MIENYNLAWEVIKNLNLPDKNVQDLYLNISGSIIKQGEKIEFFPSKAESALDVLIYGGELKDAYRFGEAQGKSPMSITKNSSIHIGSGRSEKDKISSILRSLQSKILREGLEKQEPLTESEQDIITSTQFPISSLCADLDEQISALAASSSNEQSVSFSCGEG